MHGLIFRTIQAFVTDNFGTDKWSAALAVSGIEQPTFETMLHYDENLFPKILDGCAQAVGRPESDILEDIGAYLIHHQDYVSIRRLMRFGGENFPELLHSLIDLPGRTRLAVAGLNLPWIEVREPICGQFTITCSGPPIGFGHVLVGLLRAMADDYGTLAVVDHCGNRNETEVLEVRVVDPGFAMDQGFSLARDQGADQK